MKNPFVEQFELRIMLEDLDRTRACARQTVGISVPTIMKQLGEPDAVHDIGNRPAELELSWK